MAAMTGKCGTDFLIPTRSTRGLAYGCEGSRIIHKKMPADLATTTTTTSPTVAAMCGGRKYHHYINRPVPQPLLRLHADPSLIVSPLPPPTATAAPPNPKADNRRKRFLHYPTCCKLSFFLLPRWKWLSNRIREKKCTGS
ncbi:uncharacterized protein LOC129737841 [Uranotaenia lowii]|uniref:uncharacterized protein LOC129737841 n=1 Tax=Uranotaenia lowii TaxID=190385 RepID=UPI0024794EDC|nr:uncharacterized protein LOC129737841 [Uranotaenia lowii]